MSATDRISADRLGQLASLAGGSFAGEMETPPSAPALARKDTTRWFLLIGIAGGLAYYMLT